jgi:hypothetical protein
MARKTREQLVAEIKARNARLRAIDAKAAEKKRKEDTRRKVLAGFVVLNHEKHDPAFAATLRALLDAGLTEDRDRVLFALPLRPKAEPVAGDAAGAKREQSHDAAAA